MISAQQIAKIMGGEANGNHALVPGPGHSRKDRSLSVQVGREHPGGFLVHSFAGDDPIECRDHVLARCGLEGFEPRKRTRETAEQRIGRRRKALQARCDRDALEVADREAKAEFARGIWSKAGDPADTAVDAYLQSRGLTFPPAGKLPPSIRYGHVKEPQTGLFLPAMVAAVCQWPDRTVVGAHVTYLTPQGTKAPLSTQKRMHGVCKGGAVRLAPHGETLAVGEGIESSLSYQQLTGTPTWATLSTSGLKAVTLPDNVKRIEIAADNDAAGITAARALAHRLKLEGREVVICKPRAVGHDWNDAMQDQKEIFDAG